MPGSSDAAVNVALSPTLSGWRHPLQASLGPGFHVDQEPARDVAVAVTGTMAAADLRALRAARPDLGVVVVIHEHEHLTPVQIIGMLDAGADTCVVAPGAQALAAHVKAVLRREPAGFTPFSG